MPVFHEPRSLPDLDMDINIRLLILECEEEALTIFRAVKQHFVMPSDIGCLHDFVYDARWAEYPMDCCCDPESSICPHLGYKLGQFLYPPALADLRAVVDGSNLSETGNIHTRLCLMYSNLSRDIVAATDGDASEEEGDTGNEDEPSHVSVKPR